MNLRYCILLQMFFFMILSFRSVSQVNNFANLGFERGNFDGWELSYGNVRLKNNITELYNEKNGTFSDWHKVVSKIDGNDPKIKIENIPLVKAGGDYSLRIGRTDKGNTFEKAKTSFLVTPNHDLFQYHFAVLLQEDLDNHHSKEQKPGFSLKITDQNGQQITCGDFDIQLEGKLINGMKAQNDINFRNWTTGAIDLRKHVGKYLNVEIIAHGCTGQNHFGYAYFDAELIKSEIKQLSICPDPNNNLLLKAPDGFESYVWSNGEQNPLNKVVANIGNKYKVKMTPYSSLNNTCSFELEYKIDFKQITNHIYHSICDGEVFRMADEDFSSTGLFTKTISRAGVCDSTLFLDLKVMPVPKIYPTFRLCNEEKIKIGNYTIDSAGYYEIKITRQGQCDSVVKANVLYEQFKIEPLEDQKITIGDDKFLEAKILIGNLGKGSWLTETNLLCSYCLSQKVNANATMNYYFEAESASGICLIADTVNVNVVPCNLYFPEVFTPNSDQNNKYFFGKSSHCIENINVFEIYNRWGESVYKKSNIKASNETEGWDGHFNNKPAANGIYHYYAVAHYLNNSKKTFKGSFYLIR